MDEKGFQGFLKGGGRSQNAIKTIIALVKEFERYLQEHRGGKGLEASSEDLEGFALWIEKEPKASPW